MRTISSTGQITIPPTAINSVHSKINGQVSFLKFLEGDYVRKGTLLTRIEDPQLIEKQRMLLETKAQLRQASKDFERKKILKENQATPEKTFDESQSRYELLQATYSGLKNELEAIGIDLSSLENDNNFQTTIPIYANHSGYIHEVLVNKGQMITKETCLMEIINNHEVLLELQVLSQDIAAIKKGMVVEFSTPNQANTFSATVIKINPMIDPDKSTLKVWCSIDHSDNNSLVGGSFVNAKIKTNPIKTFGLPVKAIIKEGEEYFAYQVVENEVKKIILNNAVTSGDFVTFDGPKNGQWIIEGSYYIEE